MTCIVGLVHSGKVYIGGDSAGSDGDSVTLRADKKVFVNGPFVMGFCGSFRMGQLLAYRLSPPEPKLGEDLMSFMVNDFIDAVRDCLKHGGYARIKENEEEGGTFLVGHGKRLFMIEDDFQVGESLVDYEACGSGANYALGSLHATAGKKPKDRIIGALKAAENFSCSVRGPFSVVST